ncbi:hypothetical protein [Enterococcus aquimarinus]|uniref:Uncharacterized protein n=1 Tax=Enterococcus aquimarinus TaxID=328396 RepID=A0A1L8QWR1_9ENTE|nr:hypothetical protein [Enterococcus aquimarinus]OJG11933.1 hypothetical protein RU93_GL001166 [Enterococcus aquimarinus]
MNNYFDWAAKAIVTEEKRQAVGLLGTALVRHNEVIVAMNHTRM